MTHRRLNNLLIAIIAVLLVMLVVSNVRADWMVSWYVVEVNMIPCPTPEPIPDEFGRVPLSNVTTLAICWKDIIIPMTRSFETFADAETFVQRGKDIVKKEWNPTLGNFSIKELKVDMGDGTTDPNEPLVVYPSGKANFGCGHCGSQLLYVGADVLSNGFMEVWEIE